MCGMIGVREIIKCNGVYSLKKIKNMTFIKVIRNTFIFLLLLFIVIAVIIFLFTPKNISTEKNNTELKTSEFSPKLQLAREVAQDIMGCFIDEDEERLFSLLSQPAQEFHRTKEQIQEAFDLVEGEIISYELPDGTGGGGREVENGVVTADNMTPRINNVITDSGKKYTICFQYFLIFEDDRSVEGLDNIIISLLDDDNWLVERVQIGSELSAPQVVY